MWFGRGRRFLSLCVVVLLLTWVCCQVEAIRIIPGNEVEFSHAILHNKSKEKDDLFNKHFTGIGGAITNTTQKGFHETKRRVPSCPDPLHN